VLVNLPVATMTRLQFVNVTGKAARDPNWPLQGPEGENQIVNASSALGISGHRNPYMSLTGVFLPETVNPNPQSPPPNIDFDTAAKRDFVELKPLLYQTFFIGDGLRNNKTTVQQFFVPSGATRLFLGVADGGLCHNNIGEFYLTVRGLASIQASGTTRPGGTVTLLLTGDPDLFYQVGSSLGTGPIPIGNRNLHLSPDDLLFISVIGYWPWLFSAYRGVMDKTGRAKAAINIPNIPALIGVRLHTAFVTLDPSAPWGIKSISNTFSFSITK
jgi:hypothetical protein